ncbi:DUF1566 domain-containing protein [Chloroflexota bacterium]
MNKRLLVTMILVLVIALTACGDLSTESGEPVRESAPESAIPGGLPDQGSPPDDQQPERSAPPQGGQLPGAAGDEPVTQPVMEPSAADRYVIVDSSQDRCYGETSEISCPQDGQSFFGQDAQYAGLQPSYVDNGDGTVTDTNTGLIWQQTPGEKVTFSQAVAEAETFELAGYDDWRLPTVKELYSLIDFSGVTSMSAANSVPYIDTDYFDFRYGDESAGERMIDAQYWSSTQYVGSVFGDQAAVFGVNFADGRIKGYPRDNGPGGSPMTEFALYVRGNPDYGINDFVNNADGTISDRASGLMWQAADSGDSLNWEGALVYCESLETSGYDDWRLPNAKELQSIVDYSRAPDAKNIARQGPAIDPVFSVSETESWYWTGTTHLDGPNAGFAVYITFGQANGVYSQGLVNVHGAGAQRSSPKSGNPDDWSSGHGPQNDEIRIYNYARCVRGGSQNINVVTATSGTPAAQPGAPNRPPDGGQPPANRAPAGGPDLGGEPPQEATASCSALAAEMACSFTSPFGETITGLCGQIGDGLACIPENGPPQ